MYLHVINSVTKTFASVGSKVSVERAAWKLPFYRQKSYKISFLGVILPCPDLLWYPWLPCTRLTTFHFYQISTCDSSLQCFRVDLKHPTKRHKATELRPPRVFNLGRSREVFLFIPLTGVMAAAVFIPVDCSTCLPFHPSALGDDRGSHFHGWKIFFSKNVSTAPTQSKILIGSKNIIFFQKCPHAHTDTSGGSPGPQPSQKFRSDRRILFFFRNVPTLIRTPLGGPKDPNPGKNFDRIGEYYFFFTKMSPRSYGHLRGVPRTPTQSKILIGRKIFFCPEWRPQPVFIPVNCSTCLLFHPSHGSDGRSGHQPGQVPPIVRLPS